MNWILTFTECLYEQKTLRTLWWSLNASKFPISLRFDINFLLFDKREKLSFNSSFNFYHMQKSKCYQTMIVPWEEICRIQGFIAVSFVVIHRRSPNGACEYHNILMCRYFNSGMMCIDNAVIPEEIGLTKINVV